MPRPPADPVDVGLLAGQGATVAREYPVAGFARLKDGLARPAGVARAEFRFHAANDRPALDGCIEARVWLVCQRCLGDFELELEARPAIAFVPDDDAEVALPDGYEAVAAPDGRASLAAIVEDELLLALPLVPAHATPEECAAEASEAPPAGAGAEDEDDGEPMRRPFAGLRDLLDR